MTTPLDQPPGLDLAFEAAPITGGDGIPGSETHRRLSGPDAWEADLIAWLMLLRSERNLTCPAAVRTAEQISLGIQFCDDTTIAALNAQWRQQPQATDVLSFAALEGDPPMGEGPCLELGDIIVSVETARRQADEQGHDLVRELRWLVSHGLLHLLGWDHPDEEQLTAMLQCQERLLAIDGMVQSHGEINCESTDEITVAI